MSFKKSFSNVEKNKHIWTKNLAPSTRCNVAIYKSPLSERNSIPLNNEVIGRFKFLESTAKECRVRIGLIAVELKILWSARLHFPHISYLTIQKKLKQVLREYERCRKKQNFDSLMELFDVTKVKGEWLSEEDRNLYKLQIDSKGQVGYVIGKRASAETIPTIHPSKQNKAMDSLSTRTSSLSSS